VSQRLGQSENGGGRALVPVHLLLRRLCEREIAKQLPDDGVHVVACCSAARHGRRWALVRQSISGSGVSAGPEITSPVGWKRDPWHGQSHVRSALFQPTMQPMCVHVADRTVT